VQAWMARHGRSRLVVVSPHLDDAVYSAFTILSRPLPREVVTVVTEGRPGVVTAWSTVTGFPDSEVEHRERRAEDAAVLAALGVTAQHLGAVTEDSRDIVDRIARFIDGRVPELGAVAWLLPAGAGRHHSRTRRLLRRALRRPQQAGSHPEHVQVRDAAVSSLSRHSGAIWGFYAELPYAWQEPLERLPNRVAGPGGTVPLLYGVDPAIQGKCVAAAGYRSQAAIALGADRPAQELFCSRPEFFLLA
jgi:LmbE family N-acetylglucosaminyl deacetylase